jgi:hypothetical protein
MGSKVMKVSFVTGRPIYPKLPAKLQQSIDLYQELYYAPDPSILLVTLATYVALKIPSRPPLWMMLVGGPSSGKTSTIDALSSLTDVRCRSEITVAGLLSGTPNKDRAKNATGGLLREIGVAGMLALKDFTAILSMNRDARSQLLAAFREVYDGSWSRTMGTDGGRSLEWQGKLAILAACTTAIDEHSHVMASMGERFLFYRLPALGSSEQEKMAAKAAANSCNESGKKALADGVRDFINGLSIPSVLPNPEASELEFLLGLATLIARCRSAVTRNNYTREIELVHAVEEPARLMRQLLQLEGGLSVIGVPPDWRHTIVRKVALDCIPPLRYRLVDELARSSEPLDLKRLVDATAYPKTTAWRAIDDLRAHGIVVRLASEEPETGGKEWDRNSCWELPDEWRQKYLRFPKS